MNSKRDTEVVDSIPFQNVLIDAFQVLRVDADIVSINCLDVYCGSGSEPDCPLTNEFKEFSSANENRDDYEKRLDSLVSDFVSKAFSEFKFDPALQKVQRLKNDVLTCQSKVRDFFLLEELKTKFPDSISKKKFFPGSLLRWIYVQTGR